MFKKQFNTIKVASACFVISQTALALPIDWHGVVGFDTTLIDNYRKVTTTTANVTGTGSEEVNLASGNHANSSFQTYIFRLNPHLIVNDSATIKAEITSGYGRGGRLGENSSRNKEGSFGNSLYVQNNASSGSSLGLTKFYAELYSDTATYQIGRHSQHWALGAVSNSGENIWDRHSTVKDGLTLKAKIGNFKIEPYWAKISSANSLTRATNAKEVGASLLYDNLDRDIAFGLLYAKKKNNANNTDIESQLNGVSTAIGETDVKITDIYFKKGFGDLSLQVEVPIISGEIGDLYNTGSKTKYKAKAILIEADYKLNEKWSLGFDAGKVSGDSGGNSSFEAMYLHPNYQVANLLFRYNMRAVSDPDNINIFDSYITNTTYAKLSALYSVDKWQWSAALIWAKAVETATKGAAAYDHLRNKKFTAAASQSDDLGTEIDMSVTYNWNSAVNISGNAGYLFTGDYYKFTNVESNVNQTENSYMAQLQTNISF